MSKRILVTGGCGWLGAEIVRALLARGDTAIAADIAITPVMADLAEREQRLIMAPLDILEAPQVLDTFERHRPDQVIHAAAIVGVAPAAAAPLRAQRVNVEGAVNLFEAMRASFTRRVVHVSTEETYGHFQAATIDEDHPQRPLSVYGATKLAAEHYGRVYGHEHGLECINVRTCWVYGPYLPRLRMPRTFVEAALRGEPYHQPDGASFAVDQVYIADTVAGVLLALDKPVHRFDAYHIATGQAPTLADTAEAVNRAVPGARITVGDELSYRHGGTIVSATKGALDISRAAAELGYRPAYDIQRGIEATVEATRAQLANAH